MQGHFQLNKFRSEIPEEYCDKSKDLSRLDIILLNDYLNKYTEKLARNSHNGKDIKIDQLNFNNVQKGVEKKTFNPYLAFYGQKNLAKRMNNQILRSENPRYMTDELKQ